MCGMAHEALLPALRGMYAVEAYSARAGYQEFAKEARSVSTYSQSNQSNDMGCLLTTLIVAVCLFVPVVGHIFLTVMIIGDNLTNSEKLIWLLLVWLVPVAGPLLYLLLGQRRNRLLESLLSLSLP